MASTTRRSELAAFLRSRRQRLRPEDIGLPVQGRRRTDGLRREEVAQRAGIGVTWYTWLEQGRDVRPSAAVATALAEALQLSKLEQVHLLSLIHRDDTANVQLPATALEALCCHIPSPSYVRDSAGDLLIWNQAATEFFDDFGPVWNGSANLLTFTFLNERARWTFKDWHDVASRSVAQFRRINGGCAPGTRAAAVVDHLAANSAEFRGMWDSFAVTDPHVGQKILRSYSGKEVLFSYATLASPYAPSPWITVYIPILGDARGVQANVQPG